MTRNSKKCVLIEYSIFLHQAPGIICSEYFTDQGSDILDIVEIGREEKAIKHLSEKIEDFMVEKTVKLARHMNERIKKFMQ